MTVLITLSGVGSSAGPLFDLYASPDGINFTVFLSGVNKTVLEAGYTATVPDGTTEIKVTSVGVCTNSNVAIISVTPTSTSTTTTTTTTAGCNITNPLVLSQGTSAEEACTRFSNPDNTATYYTSNGVNFANASFLNQTPICTQPAGSGWYSDGNISREYNSFTGNFNSPVPCV